MLSSCRTNRLPVSALRAHAFHAVKEQGIRDSVRISVGDQVEEIYADVGGVRHVIEAGRHVIAAVFGLRSGENLGSGQPSVAGRENIGVPALIIADDC